MQNLENDMDPIFQQAAAHYPLNTDKDDWQAVLQKIKTQQQHQQLANNSVNKRRLILILAATLLCLVTGTSVLFFPISDHNKETVKKISSDNISIDEKTKRRIQTNDQFDNSNSLTVEEVRKNLPAHKNKLNTTKKIKTNRWSSKITLYGNDANDNELLTDNKSTGSIIQAQRLLFSPVIKKHKTNLAGSNILPLLKPGSPKEQQPGNNTGKKLYIGVTTGFDFNKGASMNYKNAGWKAGIIAGYQFNNLLALETGLSWLSKTYESMGKNFSMEKVAASMPSGMVINKLNTNSSLLEIPISIKYDFHRSNKSRLFLNGGISSYIMLKEFNEYSVTLNGQQDKLTGMYMQKTIVIPAVASLSFGYQRPFLKQSIVRIEPFIKIPLKGIGIGSLPVTTAGLQLAITSHLK